MLELALPPREYEADCDAGGDRNEWKRALGALGEALDSVDHRENGGERQGRAEEVGASGVRISELREQRASHCENQHHDGHADEKHRAPPESLEQNAAD